MKDDCVCGHDRTHHYYDAASKERCNCLAMHCDCKWFRLPKDHPARCARRKCLELPGDVDEEFDINVLDDAPPTPRFPGAMWP